MIVRALGRTLRNCGFAVEPAANLQEMVRYCQQGKYDAYVMDLNLGEAASLNIAPAREVYALLREQGIEGLERKFIGVSGSLDVVRAALREGIPAVCKPFFPERCRELFG